MTAALQQASGELPLCQKGDWVVMAAWLVELRPRRRLPEDAPAGQDAVAGVDQLRTRLVALDAVQAPTFWLERRQVGHDVFARDEPEIFRNSVAAGQAIDGVEFLWANPLFDDVTEVDTTAVYRARPFELHQVAAARE